jgi:hypothetical protein
MPAKRTATEPSGQSARGLLFGAVADSYERDRLGYPDELIDIVLRYARGPCARLSR